MIVSTLLPLLVAASLASARNLGTRQNVSYDCLPGQPCWPTVKEWINFNQTVSGHLHKTVMLGSPCFPSSPDFNTTTCANVYANYRNAFEREVMGAMQYTGWETCGSANCLPSVLAPQSDTCSLGRISAYYVDAQSAADVTATLKFVKKHGIRLVVKNTGHDYLGRSSGSNTLTLRTFTMKKMEYHARFHASRCPSANGKNIGVIGAGVVAHDAVSYFLEKGMDITAGACPSVGPAGGFGQSGGHGIFGPSYGLMVDQAVEFDVVFANGEAKTINECNHADLFWAMRGGGGGTYAILVNYKFKLHPKKSIAMYSFRASISKGAIVPNVTQSKILRDTLTTLANSQTKWTNNAVAGYDFFFPDSIETHQVLPSSGDAVAELKKLTAQWESFLTNYPGYNITQNEYQLFQNQADFETGTADIVARNGGVGLGVITASRLVHRSSFASASRVDTLVGAILQGMDNAAQLGIPTGQVAFGFYKTTPANSPGGRWTTSANPAWRDALWHVVVAGGWVQGFTDDKIDAVQGFARSGLEPISAVLPSQASYTNEADFGEPDWKNVFYGANYDLLLRIKERYDPTYLFNCWKCVGWLGADEQMYSCYGNNPQPSVPA